MQIKHTGSAVALKLAVDHAALQLVVPFGNADVASVSFG
jgi:hypothetical protein